MKPTVLIIENSIDLTGGLNSVLRSSELLKDEFNFCFILPAGSKAFPTVRTEGFTVYEFPMREIRKNLISLLIYFPVLLINTIRLSRLVKNTHADLILSNDFYNLLAPLYKLTGGSVPYVCYVRFLPSRFPVFLSGFWFRCHAKYARAIIAVSEAVRRELPRHDKVLVINNESPLKHVEFIPSVSKVILYPANYTNGKGQQYALQTFAGLHSRYPDWKMRFVGGDLGLRKNERYKQKLIALSRTLGLQNFVEWKGFSQQMGDEYLDSSIVLNFSDSESFSLTCLEAMFYGRPVIATRSGGPQEIIIHQENGLLVEVSNVQAMTKALDDMLGSKDKRNIMGQRAYLHIRQKFSLEEIKVQLGETYRNAMRPG